jgi:hypothetical protein
MRSADPPAVQRYTTTPSKAEPNAMRRWREGIESQGKGQMRWDGMGVTENASPVGSKIILHTVPK